MKPNTFAYVAVFTLAVAVTFLRWTKPPAINKHPPVKQPASRPANVTKQPPSESVAPPVTPFEDEVVFGGGHLRTVVHEIQLESRRLQFKINVRYPQILGSKDLHIRKLNRRIKALAIAQYQWPLRPSRTDLRYYREKWPDVFNTIDIDYDVRFVTDSFMSIYFVGYSYGIGAAHAVQYSFVVNYDLNLRRELKLSDIFNRRSNYLKYLSRYCVNELSTKLNGLFPGALAPRAKNFQSWNITREGIQFNFDACSVFGCADGEQKVVIPFADLKPLLNPRSLALFA